MSETFVCAICQNEKSLRWNVSGRTKTIPPICFHCETHYGGKSGHLQSGSFRDRREVTRGLALAEALRCAASHKKWSKIYGYA